MLIDLLRINRSYRRYRTEIRLSQQTLMSLIELVRLIPSAYNRQPLRYWLAYQPADCAQIFPYLTWPRLGEWTAPAVSEQPSAYIIIFGDTRIGQHFGVEAGIAAQTLLLGAVEQGLGGCVMSGFNRVALQQELGVAVEFRLLLVIALGVPAETVVLEPCAPGISPGFWRDETGLHHVQKRSAEELVLNL